MMESVISIAGLLLSSASAFWLVAYEIAERHRKGNRLIEKNNLFVRRMSAKSSIELIRTNLTTAYKNIDPTGEKFRARFEEDTRDDVKLLQDISNQLEKLDEEEAKSFDEAFPRGAHLGGFMLLSLGFVMQLIAEILRAVH